MDPPKATFVSWRQWLTESIRRRAGRPTQCLPARSYKLQSCSIRPLGERLRSQKPCDVFFAGSIGRQFRPSILASSEGARKRFAVRISRSGRLPPLLHEWTCFDDFGTVLDMD